MSSPTTLLSELAKSGRWSPSASELENLPRPSRGVTAASLTINVLSLALPAVLLQIYDRIIPNTATDTLLILMLGLVAALVIDGVLRVARANILGWHAAQFEQIAGCRAVDRLVSCDIGSFEREAPGVHLDRLNAVDTLRDFLSGQAKILVVDLPFVLLFLGLVAFIGGFLVLVPMLALVLLAGAALLVGRQLKLALETRATLDDRRYSFIIEVLTGINTVKGLAMEAQMQRRYDRLQESSAASTYDTTFFSNLAQGLGAGFSNLTMVGVGALGAILVIDGQLSIGGLAACTLLAGRSVQPPLRALSLWTQFQNISVARERLQQIFDMDPEAEADAAPAGEIRGAIELRNLTFGYPGAPPLFRDVNLSIGAGEVIGVSGDTGSGKSTLLMLILNALKPTEGEVCFDGQDIRDLDPHSLREQVAYLPQSAVLFKGTIMDNLTSFAGPGKINQALEAARLLRLDEAINRLPAGYETKVGEGAFEALPTGLQQGIAMARALAGTPKVVLFDEANSGLDRRSDDTLKTAIASLKGAATVILVSHRPSLLALADRQFLLQDSRLKLKAEPQAPQEEASA
ncbi:MAG: ABC transporter transmembrane domain-containing protein [Kiloniellales bacterium]|nr:ABC transporter transmembrane domain-containing protein [Kiloniellales bacterium]